MDGYTFYIQYAPRIDRMIINLCAKATSRKEELAEALYDYALDVLPRIVEQFDNTKGVKQSTYILNTLYMYLYTRRTKWLDKQRARNAEHKKYFETRETTTTQRIDNIELREVIYLLLDKLNSFDAQILRLYYLDGLTQTEIANRLEVSQTTIHNYINEAIVNARKLM